MNINHINIKMKNKLLLIVAVMVLFVNGFSQNVKPKLELVSKGSNLSVDIYRIVGLDGPYTTFSEIFGCLSADLEKIVISEQEIYDFFQSDKTYEWLVKNNKTEWTAPFLFLSKKDGKYVVRSFYSGNKEYTEFTRFVSPLGGLQAWKASSRQLIIVPKQKN